MKRLISLIAIVALAFACYHVATTRTPELVSTLTGKLSPAIEKVRHLLPGSETEDDWEIPEDPDGHLGISELFEKLSLPSPSDIGLTPSLLNSTDDVVLVPMDDYAQSYAFEYGGNQFSAYFSGYSWKVYDSYRITNHNDIVIICQALINEHPVYGSDWESYRTAEDMAFEWDQHNLAYKVLPDSNHWKDDAKDVDLDPNDQGKTFDEIYESRTGRKLDIRNYLPGK